MTPAADAQYMDADMAYLLGLVAARGVIVDDPPTRTLSIEFPFKNLDVGGPQTKVRQNDAVTLAVFKIRERVEALVETKIEVVESTHATTLKVSLSQPTVFWRNLLSLVGRNTSYREVKVPRVVLSGSKDAAREFLKGFADVAGFVRPSNEYYGRHRVYLEVNNRNWTMPVELCFILQQVLSVPVQTIQWGHPNTRTPNSPKSKGWAKEHQVKVFAEHFEAVGFYAPHKDRTLHELAKANALENEGRKFCNPYRKPRRSPKPQHQGQDDPRIPESIRGCHFDTYWEVCLGMGCLQWREDMRLQQKLGFNGKPVPLKRSNARKGKLR